MQDDRAGVIHVLGVDVDVPDFIGGAGGQGAHVPGEVRVIVSLIAAQGMPGHQRRFVPGGGALAAPVEAAAFIADSAAQVAQVSRKSLRRSGHDRVIGVGYLGVAGGGGGGGADRPLADGLGAGGVHGGEGQGVVAAEVGGEADLARRRVPFNLQVVARRELGAFFEVEGQRVAVGVADGVGNHGLLPGVDVHHDRRGGRGLCKDRRAVARRGDLELQVPAHAVAAVGVFEARGVVGHRHLGGVAFTGGARGGRPGVGVLPGGGAGAHWAFGDDHGLIGQGLFDADAGVQAGASA